jgi:hypothetical protein
MLVGMIAPYSLDDARRARSASLGTLSTDGMAGMDGAGIPNSGNVDGKLGTDVDMGTGAGIGPATVGAGNTDWGEPQVSAEILGAPSGTAGTSWPGRARKKALPSG